MKKISILIALALIVTIGGVYATWTYEETMVNTDVQYFGVNMQAYKSDKSEKGSIKKILNNVQVRITDNYIGSTALDDPENQGGDKVPEIEVTGCMIFTFAPYNNASDDVKEHGISMEFTMLMTGNLKYNSKNIFKIGNTEDNTSLTQTGLTLQKIEAGNREGFNSQYGISLTQADEGKFIVVITAEMIANLLQFNQNIQLTTLTEYHHFEDALGYGRLAIVVGEQGTTANVLTPADVNA